VFGHVSARTLFNGFSFGSTSRLPEWGWQNRVWDVERGDEKNEGLSETLVNGDILS